MFINNRVIHKDAAVLADISALLSDPYAGEKSLAVVHADDALYVGSDMPFNHRFFMLGAAKNAVPGTITLQIYNGSEFVDAVDVQDFTSKDGVPFAQPGIIRFDLPENDGWGKVYDSSEIEELADADFIARANYWAKITFSADFIFDLKYVGFRFARDADLKTYYRDLLSASVMQAFNMGVPMLNWDEVHVMAAEEIIRDLRKKEIIISANQVLDPETFIDAACHKLAYMAFSQLKNEERKIDARDNYREAMAKMVFNVDKRGDGRQRAENKEANWRLTRV